jgi:hypothetical protein
MEEVDLQEEQVSRWWEESSECLSRLTGAILASLELHLGMQS